MLTELGAEHVPTGFGWQRMSCPFHEDRTASASVNHEKNGYRCHSCERHGDSLKLLMTERGLTFREALDLGKTLIGVMPNGTVRTVKKRRASDLLG